MFTITFYKHGTNDKTVVSGAMYSSEFRDDFRIVTVHSAINSDGEQFYLDSIPHAGELYRRSYERCFVSNAAGDTIDKLEAPKQVSIGMAAL